MNADELMTPEQWEEHFNVMVIDPDGWDRANLDEDWAKPITGREFEMKLMASTAVHRESDIDSAYLS